MQDAGLANVEAALQGLQPAWRAACEAHLQQAVPGYAQRPRAEQLKHVLQQALHSDLGVCGAATLPPGVQGLQATTLSGRFLLQLDEVVNISAPAKQRYAAGGGGAHRCLKLLLTDGVQQVAGLEYRPLPALSPSMPAGTKVLVHDVAVRRGVLLLTPANLTVLGGRVERLEQARLRMVEHWNRSAVGRRGPPMQLAEAVQLASAAAWEGQPANGGQQAAVQQQQPQQQHPPQQQQHQQQHQQQPALPPAQQQQQQQQHTAPGPPWPNQRQQQQHGAPGPHWPNLGRAPPAAGPPRQALQLPPPPQQQPQSASVAGSGQGLGTAWQGGAAGGTGGVAAQQAGGGAPLQPSNRDNGPAAGNAKRSRLQLGRQTAEPADFSFVQPGGRAPALPGHARADPVQPGTALQPHQAPADGAAGTADDPIVIDGDSEAAGASAMQVDEPAQQQQPQEDEGHWSDSWDDQPPDGGPQLEPYEVGFDDPGDWAAGADDWEAGEWGGSGWQEDQGAWGDGAGSAEQQQQEEPPDAGGAASGMEVDGQAGASAEPGGSAPPGASRAQPAQAAPQQQQPHLQPGEAEGKAPSSARRRVVVSSDGEGDAEPAGAGQMQQHGEAARHEQFTAPALPELAAVEGGAALRHRAGAPGTGLAAAAALVMQPASAKNHTGLQLAPLDDDLLKPPPSLAELLPPPQAAAAAAGHGGAGPGAATPAALPCLPRSGGRAPSSSGGPQQRVGGGGPRLAPLQLRPSLRTGTAAVAAVVVSPAAAGLAGRERAAPPAPAAPLDPAGSDSDLGVFEVLDDANEPASTAAVTSAAHAACDKEEEPFTYLFLLAQRASSAGPLDFPITASVFGMVKTLRGKLSYHNPTTGEPEYHLEMLIEDGSHLCQACLGHQFLQEFFECSPAELQARLADPATKPGAKEMVVELQRRLSEYVGLMRVQLAGPEATLEVLDLEGASLSPEQAAALCARAMR